MHFMCTMVSGFENIVKDDLQNTIPNISNIKTERGKVYFDITKQNLHSLLNVKSADNFYYLIDSFGIGAHKEDLLVFEKKISKLDISKICKFVSNKTTNEKKKIIVSASRKGKHTYSRYDISYSSLNVLIKKYGFIEGNSKDYDIAIRLDVFNDICNVFIQYTDASFKFRGTNKNFVPGGLRPTIAYGMLLISGIKKEDVFLDPFCGSGTIAIERARYNAKKIYASDINKEIISAVRENLKSNICLFCEDATKLSLKDNLINVIVSNIPWGKQVEVEDISKLYHDFLFEAKRVLKDTGRMVLLTDRDEIISEATKLNFNIKVVTTLSLHGAHPKVYYLTKR